MASSHHMNKLGKYLKRNSITQKVFAAEVGISYKHLWSILNKRSEPSLKIAVKMVTLTNGAVTIRDLLGTDEQREELQDEIYNQYREEY